MEKFTCLIQLLWMSAIHFCTISTEELLRNLCTNTTGRIAYAEPFGISDTTRTWQLVRNCSNEQLPIVVHVEYLQLQGFEVPAADVLLQEQRIDAMNIGTCYIFQKEGWSCGNLLSRFGSSCRNFVTIHGTEGPILIHLRRMLSDQITLRLNFTMAACDASPTSSSTKSYGSSAAIALGVLLAIVTLILLIFIIRQYKQEAIHMFAETKSAQNGFESLVGEYEVSPYQHYQVPNNKPLNGNGTYTFAEEDPVDSIYEPCDLKSSPAKVENAHDTPKKNHKEAVYAQPRKDQKTKNTNNSG